MASMDELRKDEMIDHLCSALEQGQDIGHYGRLVFIMATRHFLNHEELTQWLTKDRDCDAAKAQSLIRQIEQQNYNPPKRDRILQWMERQGFPICPNPENPDSCNLYKSLEFPHEVYEHAAHYREQKAASN